MERETKQLLRDVTVKYPPSTFYSAGEFFRTLHKSIKAEIKHYSYRQLSVDLGFSPTNLVHLIVQGKRPVTEKAAQKIVNSLGLLNDEQSYFFALARLTRVKDKEQAVKSFNEALEIRHGLLACKVKDEQVAYFSEWYHPVVREMILLDDFKADPEWIAKRISPSISKEEAAGSLQLLETLRLIDKDARTGRYKQRDRLLSSGADLADHLVDKFHRYSISQGLFALENLDSSQRRISAIVLGLTDAQLERVKQEIEVFHQKLFEIEGDRGNEAPNCIVRLNMQLFSSLSL